MPFVAWPRDRLTKYPLNRCPIIKGFSTQKKNHTFILNSNQQILYPDQQTYRGTKYLKNRCSLYDIPTDKIIFIE